MQMSGLTELVTVANMWRRWEDPRLIMLVLNNRDLSYVTWEQRAMEGEPRFAPSQDLPDVPYGQHAEMLGLIGMRIERPEEVVPALERALAADRPVVIDAVTDPETPNLPPTLTPEIEEKLRSALASDADAADVQRHLEREGVKI
jgi:pyruvate dehydrogenase (quinone)